MDVFKTHGAISWAELITADAAKATEFYGTLFGWQFESKDYGKGPYHKIKVGDAEVGGMMDFPPDAPKMPPNWGVYITVDDVDRVVRECQRLGGTVCMGPFDVPGVGPMAVLQDPQGAVFSVMGYSES